MTLIIVAIIIIGYVLIATGNITNVNKAAVAMFVGTVGWVLYICFGTDFVMSQHPGDYTSWLSGAVPNSTAVKHFIAENIFIMYVGRAAEVVLFLLATMTIVEILDNNGCFDFISPFIRTRNSRKYLWLITLITFVISANLDNITTTTMMLVVMHQMVPNRRLRMLYGCAIVVAANCGGALTVIGSPEGLVLWNNGAITATNFSMSLMIPCLLAWVVPTWWLGRSLPERIDMELPAMPYRGDDTNLNGWQRVLMLFVGIGGLWFIPTFHNITKMSPFVGALCVLSLLWIVNEIFNHKLMNADQMILRRMPRVLQYGVIQLMLFVMGIMLAVAVMQEIGAWAWLAQWLDTKVHNIWIVGLITGAVSSVLDNFATCMSFVSIYSTVDGSLAGQIADNAYLSQFAQNGLYWKVIAFCSAVGGNIFLIGSTSGLSLMKLERVKVGWYIRNVGILSLVSLLIGLLVIFVQSL
ncbi:MAG: sodium:proton antiporter [Prevotella sp.]|nr:sodium:proton antiporter [Prevotella sp.]